MNREIVFIADFFVTQVLGGGELNNQELIVLLGRAGKNIVEIQSSKVDLKFLNEKKSAFFIISNFVGLSSPCRDWVAQHANYIIYEHDHKYLPQRNPAHYKDFKAPIKDIRNFLFYKNAIKIICQTDFHKNILIDNLGLSNISSVGGNLWSEESLEKLREFAKREKQNKCSVMDSPIPHKNTNKAVQYCISEGVEYELVSDDDYFVFLNKLGRNNTLVFFPGTPETLSRVVCEARMMGMSVRTNGLVGATAEKWFSKKGEALIDYMIKKRKQIADEIIDLTNFNVAETLNPKVSIISTFHDGTEFLDGFLKNMVEQTMFKDCELILVDADSQHDEKQLITSYQEKHNNIKYLRVDELLKPTPCINAAIKEASGEYLTLALIDDRKSKTCIEELYTAIQSQADCDLVYGDVAVSQIPNEQFGENNLGKMFEHSQYSFSRENMVKCLPGPMPLWRRSIHDKCGFFDEDDCNYADDWEMWLRMVEQGSRFKKLDKIVGLYLLGGRSQQENLEQRKEEAKIFFKYSHLFGYNFVKYAPYFRQFVEA